ncbi:Protease 1 precursor [Methanoculleus chikugoensis]|uniref:Protease 1 n=1 Tax=Methanoculleus chikugoensis TaxID=118126 RepID=A0A1M4MH05_9EURY|nr:PKD domain-containing protein [Methanoculleus chikugoensis]SCL74184.1 Protease 1 precursor [Methanoculleus chikugoensis]
MSNDTATSDLIATMALIAVFVTAVAILGVALLSSPPGDAAPAMLARSVVGEDGKLSIHHDGGDSLERGRFAILVDGVRRDDLDLIDASGVEHDTWTSWETGEALVLGGVPEGAHIQIVAGGVSRTGSTWLLHDFGNGSAAEQVPLVAGFTADPTSGPAPLPVQFTDTSAGGATSWSWSFGDGGTSTAQNPIYVYVNPGTYTVTLTANNARGNDTETKPGYITVATPIIADFTADVATGTAPLTVRFTDLSSGDGLTSWFWNFGDGGTSTAQNPVHTYNNIGTYTVSLTVENALSNETVTKSNYITVAEEHISRLEVNSVRQRLILGGYISVNDIGIGYTGGSGTGSDMTPFALSRTALGDSGFSVTLTAPDSIGLWPLLWDFERWEVGDTSYGSRIISVSVADDERRTATAYYDFWL